LGLTNFLIIHCFFGFHHQFNLVRGSVLVSSGFSPLPIAVAGDRTVVLSTKFSVNHNFTLIIYVNILSISVITTMLFVSKIIIKFANQWISIYETLTLQIKDVSNMFDTRQCPTMTRVVSFNFRNYYWYRSVGVSYISIELSIKT
jgi:hypothetical protein